MRNMRSVTLTAAIATVLSQKFVGTGGAEVVPREPENYPAPVWSGDRSSRSSYPVFDSLDKRKKANRRKNKAAAASRKRNRK